MINLTKKTAQYLESFGDMNANTRRFFTSTVLNGLSQGIFQIVFNLYIIQIGIPPDTLGLILSSNSVGQAVGSIPIAFLSEIIGYKKVLLFLFLGAGLTRLLQSITPALAVIVFAAFTGGVALAGDFVVRLPFLSTNTPEYQHTKIFSLSSILLAISIAIGSLIGGFMPGFLSRVIVLDQTLSFRYTLFFSGCLAIIGALPILGIKEQPIKHQDKISLAPYLWGLDSFTVKTSLVSYFVGAGLGVVYLYMNLFFINYLGSSLEVFGTVSGLLIIPSLIITAAAPMFARSFGSVKAITCFRWIAMASMVVFAFTKQVWVGAVSFWSVRSFIGASQPLSFAFIMKELQPKTKAAGSAWLNVSYWLGNASVATISGLFIEQGRYRIPMLISAGVFFLGGLLNLIFFHRIEVASDSK